MPRENKSSTPKKRPRKRKYIVSISGGAGSTIAAHIVSYQATVKHFGLENVVLLFADTNTESQTLYDLLNMMQIKIKKIVWLDNGGKDIWDIFDQFGIIRTPTGACKASLELKQKPIARWVTENCDLENTVLVSGLDWTEETRVSRFDARWIPYKTWHPLNEPENKMALCDMKNKLKELGYPPQELYEKEYPHNNCGGACVLAGLAQWAGLKSDYPERFEYHKRREAEFNKKHDNKFTVLRDQRGGKVTPLSLTEFENRLNTNTINLRDFRTGCGCMLGEQLSLNDLVSMDANEKEVA